MAEGDEQCPERKQPRRRTLFVHGIRPMFLSLPLYEFQVPKGLAEPGGKHWRVVETPLHAPWYLLTVEQGDPNVAGWPTSRTLCIAWETDLADAIESVELSSIRGLLAMIPQPRCANGQWACQSVSEVWLDRNEAGSFVTLLDADGIKLDAGTLIEPPEGKGKGELLLRLDAGPRALRPGSPGSGRARPQEPKST